jgi:signal peptidase I
LPFHIDQEVSAVRIRIRRAAAVFAALALGYIFIAEAAVVPSSSMEGTVLVGDHILLDKFLYGPSVPFTSWHLSTRKTVRRGAIIAFKFPLNPQINFLKRVAAVGGDVIEIRNGVVCVNHEPLSEPYVVHSLKPDARTAENMVAQIIPQGQLFVLGDNRDNSEDSRYWGTVPLANVIGEPLLVYWSYDAPSAAWPDDNPLHQLRFYTSAMATLFTRTRWSRTGVIL